MLDGTDKIRSAKGVIYYQRQAVPVGKLGQSVDIGNIAVGVAERFDVDGSRIILNCRLDLGKVVNIYKGCSNTEVRTCMCKQIVATTGDGLLR